MKVKRVIIEGIMAHFGYGMSGKTQKTYEIPNPSTIVGIIENLYDLDRVYLSLNGDDNERLTIRTWDMHKEGDRVRVWYTLFDENERTEDGSKFKIEDDGNILIY